jgi:hypothetical protein
MMKSIFCISSLSISIALIFPISTLNAQFTHTFTQIARNTEYGNAETIAIGADGIVFLTAGYGGLRAYSYDGYALSLKAHVDDGGEAKSLKIADDGTIFLANGFDGLRAYSFDGNSFTGIGHDLIGSGDATDVTMSEVGNIYLANGMDGLRVYNFDGYSFTQKAHAPIDSGIASGVRVGPDGTIFLVNAGYFCISTCAGEPDDGLRAYIYDGNSLINTAHINEEGLANGLLAVDPDGIIFLGNISSRRFKSEYNEYDGIRAYTYNDTSFNNIFNINKTASAIAFGQNRTLFVAQDSLYVYTYDDTSISNIIARIDLEGNARGMAIGSEGDIFLACDNEISVFKFDNSKFTKTAAESYESGFADGVAVDKNGTVFLANGDDGIRAYRYNGTSTLNNIAHINNGEGFGASAVDIASGSEGDVFVAYHINGLRAYSFMGDSLTGTAHVDDGRDTDYARGVAVGPNGTVYLANGDDGLIAYRYSGISFSRLANINNPYEFHGHSGVITTKDVAVDSNGTVFLAFLSAGLWAYRRDGSSFITMAHSDEEINQAYGVAVGPDGTVFLANGDDGLRAYYYNGSSFTNTAHIFNGYGEASAVAVGRDGTVFLACDGLRAYFYDGTSFTNTAHINDGGGANDVTVGIDGTVYLATRYKGLIAYKYSPLTNVNHEYLAKPNEFKLVQNYPNPFNPSTTMEFTLPKSDFVELKVYNILGKEVSTLVSKKLNQGSHTYTFDGKNLASGVYYYQLVAGDYKEVKKMILLR